MSLREPVLAALATLIYRGESAASLPDRLPLPIWNDVKRAMEHMGGTWNNRTQEFSLPGHAAERVAWVLRNREVETAETFSTPAEIAADLAEWAVRPGDVVLEPSCGEGPLVRAAVNAGAAAVTCMEIDPRFAGYTEDWLRSHAVVDHPLTFDVITTDFLHHPPVQSYDSIVMCPPLRGSKDVDHVRHAFEFLKPGGRLAALMSGHARTGYTAKPDEFRVWMRSLGGALSPPRGAEIHVEFVDGAPCVLKVRKPS